MAETLKHLRQPVRVVFKQIMAGDRRKVIAESNDADTGGGARDFRFNHEGLGPAFAQMFPDRQRVSRRRDGRSVQIGVYVGRLVWLRNPRRVEAGREEMPIIYEPPTTARGAEGRIAKVHEYPPFRRFPQEETGMVLLLLVEDQSGAVWPFYVTEESLAGKRWNRTLADAVIQCISHTPSHHAVQGFVDFRSGSNYCNARDRTR